MADDGRVLNIASQLVDVHVAAGFGDRPALVLADTGRLVTYRELQATVNRAANVLRGVGIEPEQRVAIVLPDGLAFVAAFIGTLKVGAVPVPLNTAAPPSELGYMLANCRARVLIGSGDAPDLKQSFTENSFAAALEGASEDAATFPTGIDEPAYWLYSSGTTGRPKGTVHLHGDMLACVQPYAAEVVDIDALDRTFSIPRLFFSYGLVNSLFLPLLNGASTVLLAERPTPGVVLDVVRRFAPTLFFGVPTAYAQLCEALGDTPALGSVRLAISAGEALPAQLYERWQALTGVELLDGLGSTEVGYIFCSNRPGGVKPGSSGQPIGPHELRIVDELGWPVDDDVPGELEVRASSTALYYWNQQAQTRATFAGAWLRTGDQYRRDGDGYYWHLGRLNDVFKVSGQWVAPLEVESCLCAHPAVLEAAVVAFEDASGLLKPRAFVVLRRGLSATTSELQAFVRERLKPHMYPREVAFVDALPKTTTGKTQRYKLR